jgi:transcriptional regulator with XRE-family HTH domain
MGRALRFRADRLRELLEARDPAPGRQRRAARVIGVTEQVVSEWLRGRKQPGSDVLVDLAAYLGTTADDLLPPTVRTDRPASGE